MKSWFQRPEKFGRRLIMMILGVIVQGLGLSLLIKMQFGTDPCSCLTQGVSNYLPLSFGTCQLLCHLVTFIFVIKYDRSFIGWGTVGNMVCLGYIVDGFTYIFDNIIPIHFGERGIHTYIMLLIALVIFLIGAATYMSAGIGSSPYDALPFIISEHCKKVSFKVVRMAWDISFMLAGFCLGGDVGIVTLGVAFGLGPVISKIQKILTKAVL